MISDRNHITVTPRCGSQGVPKYCMSFGVRHNCHKTVVIGLNTQHRVLNGYKSVNCGVIFTALELTCCVSSRQH